MHFTVLFEISYPICVDKNTNLVKAHQTDARQKWCPKWGTATERTDKTDWGEIQDTHKPHRTYRPHKPHEKVMQTGCPK